MKHRTIRQNRVSEPRWATSSDWEDWRDQIEQLYQSHKLEEVIRVMKEQYGFKAT